MNTNDETKNISDRRFGLILENLGTQLVQIMENNNNLLKENLRLWQQNSELFKENQELKKRYVL